MEMACPIFEGLVRRYHNTGEVAPMMELRKPSRPAGGEMSAREPTIWQTNTYFPVIDLLSFHISRISLKLLNWMISTSWPETI